MTSRRNSYTIVVVAHLNILDLLEYTEFVSTPFVYLIKHTVWISLYKIYAIHRDIVVAHTEIRWVLCCFAVCYFIWGTSKTILIGSLSFIVENCRVYTLYIIIPSRLVRNKVNRISNTRQSVFN